MMDELMQVSGVEKSYPQLKVLSDINFSLAKKETLAIIGPNGAGKTTLFKVVTGEVSVDAGSIRFDGSDITSLSADVRTRLGFGRSFQVSRIFPDLTSRENLIVAIEAAARNRGERTLRAAWWPRREHLATADELLGEVGLSTRHGQPAKFLAHGDKKRLELACCLALNPRVLMLDEPTAGMSQGDRRAAVSLIARVRDRYGMAMMLTEHDMEVVFGLASRIIVLNYGQIVAQGSIDEIRANPKVKEIYLGGGAGHA